MFSNLIIDYNTKLDFQNILPPGIEIMNPYKHNQHALEISSQFYNKFYNDNNQRILILGINPGRLGAGITGVPFSDTKRLGEFCGLHFDNLHSHEPSSVFMYDIINQYGGPTKFFNKFYINSVCPLGFVKVDKSKNRQVNMNYYDSNDLLDATRDYIVDNLRILLNWNINTSKVYILGNGKNYQYFSELNSKYNFFHEVVPLEHPRYIIQYHLKRKEFYIQKYLNQLK